MKIKGKELPFYVVKRSNSRERWYTIFRIVERNGNVYTSDMHFIIGWLSHMNYQEKYLQVKSVQSSAFSDPKKLFNKLKQEVIRATFERDE